MTEKVPSTQYLTGGAEYLAQFGNFKLVGREKELKELSSILMRSRANSVLLVSQGGVGASALVLGLQAMKSDVNAPFDIVSKRMFWLDVDALFALGDGAAINTAYQKILKHLYRTPESVLIVEDSRDFIEASRNSGNGHFINALTSAIDAGKTQVILETRDDDLDMVLKCHSDMRECFTMMDLEEPTGEALHEIVAFTAANLSKFHDIKISEAAITTAIELTNKYRTKDAGLSRAQPERSVTLLDRALSSYRLSAHEKPEHIRLLEEELRVNGLSSAEKEIKGHKLIAAIDEWADSQAKIKEFNANTRAAERQVVGYEEALAEQLAREAASREESKNKGEQVEQRAAGRRVFGDIAAIAGFESPEVKEIRAAIDLSNKIIKENREKFTAITAKINEKLELTRDIVLREFSHISGLPVNKLNEDERVKLSGLLGNLKARIYGQDPVLEKVANGIRVARFGRRSKGSPLPFLFLGPSGVGKTELAKAVAASLLDDESALTRFDMSEYMEKHAVAKLIGAPPGYEGFEVGGVLTNAMRKNPNRVLLFDEIEKAHDDVFNIFLQILSDGRLSDSVGRTVSFADAIVIMTTNIGQTHFLDLQQSQADAEKDALEELGQRYRSELLNRFNGRQNIICFNRLELPAMEKIVRREITAIDASYRDQGISTFITDESVHEFCKAQYNPILGARGLPGYITANLEPIIVNTLLEDRNANGVLNMTWNNETKCFDVALEERSQAA
jgi:ATP-dependent Clp protease ATP-binding subunit ClpB